MFHKHRLEALSDAVVAIAMTLLILEIKVPTQVPPGRLAAAVLHEDHAWISFGISFFLASVFWVLQHRVFDAIAKTGPDSVVLTFVFLAFISTLPFSTALWGHYLGDKFAADLYFGNQLALALALTAKLEIAHWRRHTVAEPEVRLLRLRLYLMSAVFLICVLATPFEAPRHIWIAPFVAVLGARLIRNLVQRRWKRGALKSVPAAGQIDRAAKARGDL